MKGNIIVMSYSGNVGKSTIIRHMLMPHLTGYVLKEIESINSSGNDAVMVNGENVGKHLDELILADNNVFDVGASNVERFVDALKLRDGAHEDIALFIVPVTPDNKQIADGVNTIRHLIDYGVDQAKVLVIFNRVPVSLTGEDVKEKFMPFFKMKDKWPGLRVSVEYIINQNELFDKLTRQKLSVPELALDATDYKSEIVKTGDEKVRAELAKKLTYVRMARALGKQLDTLYGKAVENGSAA